MVAHNEKEQYNYCCEVFRKIAEIDEEGRIMKRVSITLYISLAVSVIALLLLNDIDAFLTSFLASVAIVMSIEALDNKKQVVMAVPLYTALAIAVHHTMLLFIGREKPLNVQVIEIMGLTAGIAVAIGMIKTIFLDNNKSQKTSVQAVAI